VGNSWYSNAARRSWARFSSGVDMVREAEGPEGGRGDGRRQTAPWPLVTHPAAGRIQIVGGWVFPAWAVAGGLYSMRPTQAPLTRSMTTCRVG
jgi:hypothetical protein